MPRRSGLAPCLAAAALAPAVAAASPLEDTFLGGAVFTGPANAHATALHYNPAALALDSGTHVFVSGDLRIDRLRVDRAPIDDAGVPGGTRDPGDARDTLATPGGYAAFYSDVSGGRVTLGLAVYTPYAERYMPGRRAARYHTLGGHYYDITVTPGIAFRINSRIAVGFGVSVVAASLLDLEFARDTALEAGSAGLRADCGGAPCGAENPDADQRYRIAATPTLIGAGSSVTLGFHLGVALTLRDRWHVGVGYASPTSSFGRLVVETDGRVDVDDAPRAGGGHVSGRARIIYRLPQTIGVGVRGPAFGGLEWVANARWLNTGRHRRWDVRLFGGDLAGADVPDWYPRYRGLRDVFAVEAGLEQPAGRRVRLGARLRAETAGVDASRTAPNQMYGANAGVAVGAEWRATDALALSAGYALVWFPDVTADPSAFDPAERVACADAGYPIDECTATREGRGIPTAAGTYRRLQNAMSIGIKIDWL
ncbi:MAG: hypothetical protein D6689_04255 [Deltaproteobacteria bacterium]|nr:MAG: hypothetical protein D6689_04255 [Deltaproteobacteria bacterium]